MGAKPMPHYTRFIVVNYISATRGRSKEMASFWFRRLLDRRCNPTARVVKVLMDDELEGKGRRRTMAEIAAAAGVSRATAIAMVYKMRMWGVVEARQIGKCAWDWGLVGEVSSSITRPQKLSV